MNKLTKNVSKCSQTTFYTRSICAVKAFLLGEALNVQILNLLVSACTALTVMAVLIIRILIKYLLADVAIKINCKIRKFFY